MHDRTSHVSLIYGLFLFSFQKLGSPTLAVTSESFVPMLSRLDECIAYLNQNVSNDFVFLLYFGGRASVLETKNCSIASLQPQYKESSVYMAKFKSCLARALSLIKTHVVNVLQNATLNVMPKKVRTCYFFQEEAYGCECCLFCFLWFVRAISLFFQ